MEKEEAFYFLEHNQLVKQTGYYIYYEKNEEMQNYMVENKDPVHEEADFNDQTTRKIRTVIQEKKDPKEDKSIVRLMYTASTLMAIIVLVIAATMLKNYEQMRDMQVAIHALSENLGNQAQANDGDTDATDAMPVTNIDTPSTDSKTADDQTKDGKDIVEVETVAGNVEPTKEADAGQNQQTEDNDHSTDGNNNNGTAEIAEGTGNNSSATEETKAAAAETKAATEETKEASAETNEVKETVKETKYYVVKSGDSLAGISFKLYSSANYVTKIMELNGIEDQDKIYAGQTLIVP
jgi:LysM repeat protein